MLFMPIVVLFYKDNGLSITQIMLIQAIYSITIACIEIPSGFFADIMGRKKSISIGMLFNLSGMIIYCFANSFWSFLPAALCLGIGQSFISGSDTALLYDSLKELNREKEFIKLEGKTIFIGNFAEAIAFIIGGFLAEISLRTPFYYQTIIAAIGFFIALFLIEPSFKKIEVKHKHLSKFKEVLTYIFKEKKLLNFLLYSSIIGVITLTMAWFVQPYFIALKLPVKYFGVAGALLNLTVAIAAFFAYKIEKKVGSKNTLFIIFIIAFSTYIILSLFLNYWMLAVLGIFYFMRGVATPVLRDYINQYSPSEIRATIMSLRGFAIRVMFALISPFLGFITDVYTIQEAFLLFGVVVFVVSGIAFLLVSRTLKQT